MESSHRRENRHGLFFGESRKTFDRAAELASEAFPSYSRLPGRERVSFLNRIASRLESITDLLVARAHAETALPEPRLKSETAARAINLRLFASVVEEGSWVSARIDHADPQRKPLPKPDVRSMLFPLGPVVVFGASNFPLAFSVAGGDTASALAAGNPANCQSASRPSGHQRACRARNSRLRSRASFTRRRVLLSCSTPERKSARNSCNIRSSRPSDLLVQFAAGRALMDLAVRRPEPIPFYGEMGSTNPVFILPGALAARGKEIASQLHGSFTLGSGQFCTKPGLVFLPKQNPPRISCLNFKTKSPIPPNLRF